MYIRKSGGKIFGASLTASEKKALDIEIKRQLADYDKKHELELDALVLWTLHEQFGFGQERLRRFYNSFGDSINRLIEHYELDDSDKIWICTEKLKDYGINLEDWAKERR